MSEYVYSREISVRIKNLDDYVTTLEKEKSLREMDIREKKQTQLGTMSTVDSIYIIEQEKKVIELTQEITSKKEFLAKLRAKGKEDEKEFKKNLAEATARYSTITGEAEEFLNEDEIENDGFSWSGNMINFQYNCLILSKKEEEEGKYVFYYNALKKELKLAKAAKENKKIKEEKNAEEQTLKVSE